MKIHPAELKEIMESFPKNRGLLRNVLVYIDNHTPSMYELRSAFIKHSSFEVKRAVEELKHRKLIEVKDDGCYHIRT